MNRPHDAKTEAELLRAAEENPGCALKLETDGAVTAVKACRTSGPWKLDNSAEVSEGYSPATHNR